MESIGGFRFVDSNKAVRKKRSNPYRRPRNDSDYRGNSSMSSSPLSDNRSKGSSENTGHDTNYRRKELNLNQCSSRASYTNLAEAENDLKISVENEAGKEAISDRKGSRVESKRSSEGALGPASWKSTSKTEEYFELQMRTRDTQISRRISGIQSYGQSDVASDDKGLDNKVKKVKLKVGGVVRTIHAKPAFDTSASVGESSSIKSLRCSDTYRLHQNPISQEKSDEDPSTSPDMGSGMLGIPWKDFSGSGFRVGKVVSSRGKILEESFSIKKSDKYEPVRKSKRVPKRRLLDGALSDEDDDEIRYLEKLKTSKTAADFGVEYDDENEVGRKKQRKISRVLSRNVGGGYNVDVGRYGLSRSGKESKKSKTGRESEDTDYVEEEEQESDGELDAERKKQRKELVDVMGDSNREMAITTRQRALQAGKDVSSSSGAGLVKFPNELPPAPPRKQKDKLSEVDQQLKKAEAAQRRRMQVEKAARESEAEAIRKILCQDSSRKKRENKIKQRQEELVQERNANARTLASNTVRWVIGPTGTVVTFSDDMGLPTIFEPKPCSYPPPREKCAAPSCSNPYKYRDSRSKLPLCSLQCYKAVNEKMQPVNAC